MGWLSSEKDRCDFGVLFEGAEVVLGGTSVDSTHGSVGAELDRALLQEISEGASLVGRYTSTGVVVHPLRGEYLKYLIPPRDGGPPWTGIKTESLSGTR